jgi:hypothetical protein
MSFFDFGLGGPFRAANTPSIQYQRFKVLSIERGSAHPTLLESKMPEFRIV